MNSVDLNEIRRAAECYFPSCKMIHINIGKFVSFHYYGTSSAIVKLCKHYNVNRYMPEVRYIQVLY